MWEVMNISKITTQAEYFLIIQTTPHPPKKPAFEVTPVAAEKQPTIYLNAYTYNDNFPWKLNL